VRGAQRCEGDASAGVFFGEGRAGISQQAIVQALAGA
jgi:hypothetical protein